MKVKNFDKVIPFHLGAMFEAADENSPKITEVHRQLLATQSLTDSGERLYEFAKETLSPLLAEIEIHDPAESVYSHSGFGKIEQAECSDFAAPIPGTHAVLLRVENRERVLPGISVRNEVGKRMAALVEKEIDGWEPTRKDWAEMKADVEANMLKTAPIRPSSTYVLLSVPYVFVFTSSAKKAELCTALLRKALGSFPVEPLFTPEPEFQSLVLSRIVTSQVPDFSPGTFAHLRHEDGDDVKLKDTEIRDSDTVYELIQNDYHVRQADMIVKTEIDPEGTLLKLSDKGIITGLFFQECDSDSVYDEAAERYGDKGNVLSFIANVFLVDVALRSLVDAFRENTAAIPDFTADLAAVSDDEEV